MPTVGTVKLLNRSSPRRTDETWQADRLGAAETRFLLLIDLKPAISSNEERTQGSLRWFSHEEVGALGLARDPAVFLGLDQQSRCYFSIAITEHRARTVPGGPFSLKPYVDLRSLAVQGVLTPDELSLAGQARAIAEWHTNARCCGHCGSATDIKDGGWRRKCWSCGRDHFPRTDPVVIMLVTRGDRCLLAASPRFSNKLVSALAGFLEPGEDIEHAVRREVKEEVGIDVGHVTYQESQPWPFPHSLMIGCQAEGLNEEIVADPEEITLARWFSREEAAAMLEDRHPEGFSAPGRHAIAYKLLKAFVAAT